MSQKDREHRGSEGAAKGHKHDHGHQHGHQHGDAAAKSRGLHRDWRLWAAVILALVAMGVYVLTMDESLRPWGGGPAVPADAPVPVAP
jgi:hypothetical protein